MYAKYTTEACVVNARERGEADRVYTLYTREFGLVHARASSVRREASRMRTALTTGACITVSLVKGKRGWRLAGAIPAPTLPLGAPLATYARILRLVERLVHGEAEDGGVLFEVLMNAHGALIEGRTPEGVELLTVARLLYHLGYLSPQALRVALIARTSYSYEEVDEVLAQRSHILTTVNSAITATQL